METLRHWKIQQSNMETLKIENSQTWELPDIEKTTLKHENW